MTAFFASKSGGEINILRAAKLIYLSDRASMEKRERPITGDDFVSMPFGPVNTYTYSLMNHEGQPDKIEVWSQFIQRRRGHSLRLAGKISIEDLDELSRSDIRLLGETWDNFKDIDDQFALAEWTHKFCPEWRDPNGSSIPIPFSTVFNKLKKQDPADLADLIQAERQFVTSLNN